VGDSLKNWNLCVAHFLNMFKYIKLYLVFITEKDYNYIQGIYAEYLEFNVKTSEA